ncbi:hypothetical protein LBMAG49_15020 [Planctomycetota bacterium]|jgi:hypothetical protein|nr:hypothetical protein [Planctomycetota bacterium]MSR39040.1 hypothetical protein [Planctomycetota bacterium]GDY02173.1 hypothetical protein LBMAG49_15020 [Planctomycetota bacterium]
MRDLPIPWIAHAQAALDLRRKDRVLLCMPNTVAAAQAVAALIGDDGRLVVLEPDRRTAAAIARAMPQAEVITQSPRDHRYGFFDAVLATPLAAPLPQLADLAAMLRANLRPGGRFVIDLPGETMLPALQQAAANVSPECAQRIVAALSGVAEAELCAALKLAGLRRTELLLGTHLLNLASPLELLDLAALMIPLDERERMDLGDALLRTLGATSNCEALAQRSAVVGLR